MYCSLPFHVNCFYCKCIQPKFKMLPFHLSNYIMHFGVFVHVAATGDMPAYQIRSPSSGLPPGVVMAASPGAMHSPQPNAEEATRKREVRLMKNRYPHTWVSMICLCMCLHVFVFDLLFAYCREAARECRRKKKEYVKCLENRVAVLENQNKTLIEELKALKDIYCHKPE